MRPISLSLQFALLPLLLCLPLHASQSDALAIDASIQARHLPFGTILDPIYASPTSTVISGYTRCGDSALWTGAYLAAESFRYKVTQSADALNNVKSALSGIKSLVDVTGDDRLARCVVPANSPYAAGIESEEASNTIHQAPPNIWVDNTSRDEVVGVYFGLCAAFDLVSDSGVQASASSLATRMAAFISNHNWTPNDDLSNTFLLRPEQLQMILQVTRHVNPADSISGPFLVPPVDVAVAVDTTSLGSYFKFNLDYMSFYNLVRLQDNSSNRGAYNLLRNATATHQNPFFDLIDRALNGANASRDAETLGLLNDWLQRPNRDFSVDLSKTVAVCGSEACFPAPVAQRPPTDFLWQRDPYQVSGGGDGFVESAGIDYILPYWMARYYGVLANETDSQSSAAAIGEVAPNSLASIYGSGLAPAPAQAATQPLPTNLAGVTVAVTDSNNASRPAPLVYVSPTQINFVVPDATAAGPATITVSNNGAIQIFQAAIRSVAPSLFSMNGNGAGVAAATAIRTQAANPNLQSPVTVFQCNSSGCAAVPIALGVDTPVYLTLYGTGFRGRSALANVSVTINGIGIPAQFAGATPGFTGLDQVNVPLPITLRGAGLVNVTLTVDSWTSNVVTISIQ